ncbi:MAG TPA: TatD family hydrolase [Candidatus Kapabacteria bacterium]|nr:TatD family hydrolase [Candidatus Kapabacteria bacterium]
MFDTHCHLQDKAFDADRDEIMRAAREAGVSHFLVPATDLASFPGTLSIANSENRETSIYCALGIHPHSATEWNADIRRQIKDNVESNSKVVAIGEIGLDYHYDFSPRDVQRRAFFEQIELAVELQKPIIIHTRESEDDVFRIVEEFYNDLPPEQPRGQFHCFSGTVELMQKSVALGFSVSFTGNITFKNSTLADVVRLVPLDAFLIETDSPYLAPVPHRGKRNSPVFLKHIAEKVAEIKGLDVSNIMKHTFENALKTFRIPHSLALIIILAFSGLLSSTAFAQVTTPGAAPPDSILTGDRRKTEELRKKQEEELAREAVQHRQDSIQDLEKARQESVEKAQQQVRQDSIKAAQQIIAQDRAREFLLTPQPWKAIGIGGSAGVGNMQMDIIVKRSLTATSVFEPAIQISTELTRRLDIEISYAHMDVSDNFPQDSVYNFGAGTSPNRPYMPNTSSSGHPPTFNSQGETRLIQSEDFGISALSFDARFVITQPSAIVGFYVGAGYTYLTMTNTQHYALAKDSTHSDNQDHTYSVSFHRGALKLLFGARHDFELGGGFTLEPFGQIAMIAAFQGSQQQPDFVFRPTADQIIATQASVGVTLYYGWFGVPRQ